MNDQRRETRRGTFHDHFFALTQIQDVDSAVHIVRHPLSKPVATCFNEFPLVQTGSLLAPSISLLNRSDPVYKVLLHPTSRPIPLNVVDAMLQVNRSWKAIESQSPPVPHFESKDVWRRADLEHHAVSPGAVGSTGRNQKVIVFARGPLIYILVRRKGETALLSFSQIRNHCAQLDVLLQAEIDRRILCRIQKVITLILCVMHSEMFLIYCVSGCT